MYFLRFFILLSLSLFISCDDGDSLISDFDFDTDDMVLCSVEDSGQTVFYNYNSSNYEVVYATTDDEFDGKEELSEIYNINETDIVVQFIKFSSSITASDFFCSSVSNTASIEKESTAESGEINVDSINTINLDEDEDGDGLYNLLELISDSISETDLTSLKDSDGEIDLNQVIEDFGDLKDSDSDGIPDFRDEDDDNDNVKTSFELYEKDDEGNDVDQDEDNIIYLNTDEDLVNGDDIPDYLDNDDDGDGVFTLYEFETSDNISPRNSENKDDNGDYHYLNAVVAETGTHEEDIILYNSYTTNFETIVTAENLQFTNGSTSVTPTYFVVGESNDELTVEHEIHINSDGTYETYLKLDDDIENDLIKEGIISDTDDEAETDDN